MRIIALILLAISAIALLLAALTGLHILTPPLLGVGGKGLSEFSTACSLFAIALHVLKPFEKKETSA